MKIYATDLSLIDVRLANLNIGQFVSMMKTQVS